MWRPSVGVRGLTTIACLTLAAAVPPSALASGTCDLNDSTATMTVTISAVGATQVSVTDDGEIRVDGVTCSPKASVHDVDTIRVVGSASADRVHIDESRHPFAPGASPEGSGTPELELHLSLGEGVDSIVWHGSPHADTARALDTGVKTNGDGDVDLTLKGVEALALMGKAGKDSLHGNQRAGASSFTAELVGGSGSDALRAGDRTQSLQGGPGDDVLDAGAGDDQLWGGAGSDKLNGGSDRDRIYGGSGDDTIGGGRGVDHCYQSGGMGLHDSCEKPGPAATKGFEKVHGRSARVGTGPVVRFSVEVQRSTSWDAIRFAQNVSGTLFDDRGWTGERVTLQRVDDRTADFRLLLASRSDVDRLCAPVITKSQYSCFNEAEDRVVVNGWRWRNGSPAFPNDVARYRRYVVNHEVGHALGHDHYSCSGKGALAPVMKPQTAEAPKPCRSNPWPLAWERQTTDLR